MGGLQFDLISTQLMLVRSARSCSLRTKAGQKAQLVFYVPDIEASLTKLNSKSGKFLRNRIPDPIEGEHGFATIFPDPLGQRICLYQPSSDSLTWESGPKVESIMSNYAITV